jgi:L-amino acid N-acyltransferase YncA
MKTFDEKFDDSTIHTFYSVTITSENGQRITFKEVRDFNVREIYDQLVEQAEE